jgi:hypothetical protein
MNIKKVKLIGNDLLEVTREFDGEIKIIRRRISNYASMSLGQKEKVIVDIAYEGIRHVAQPIPTKSSFTNRLKNIFKK